MIRQFDLALAPYPEPDHAFYFSPLKLFQYMACGVAVVASRIGQISEVIEHGKSGMLCPAGDIDALAESCDQLLGNSQMRMQIAGAGARVVHDRYTWDQNAARVVSIFNSLRVGSY